MEESCVCNVVKLVMTTDEGNVVRPAPSCMPLFSRAGAVGRTNIRRARKEWAVLMAGELQRCKYHGRYIKVRQGAQFGRRSGVCCIK
jgi:hypothetical protein